MTASTDNQVKLPGGYTVGYAEYGDLGGNPILHFHGLPSSRFELHSQGTDDNATRLHARVISLERPGIGLSDYRSYTITTWPDIVTQFADALKLERFAVMGYSSGGKYVSACAWKIPNRLTAAGIISGNCLYTIPGSWESLSKQDRQLYMLADKAPWLFRIVLSNIARGIRKDPGSIVSLFPGLSEVDQHSLSQPDVQQIFAENATEIFRQGTRGVGLDWKLEARPWGFSLDQVKLPIHIWHGAQDRLVDVRQGKLMANSLPNARLTIYPDDGHITILSNHFEEIIGTLVGV